MMNLQAKKLNMTLYRITIAIFAIALVFSFFHYHTTFEYDEKTCLLCTFSYLIKVAAFVYAVIFAAVLGRSVLRAEKLRETVEFLRISLSLRAPPLLS